ncbi:MAG TPA: VOC family protein [Vicinamibacterales bacterium]|nr:VOC family protein [Vicinamibacterales bacterium]
MATLEKAFGYHGDTMSLPVKDLDTALSFYETVLGFRVLSRTDTPHRAAVLARDGIQIGLAENGGDPTQDGCAFHVTGLETLFAQFKANGLQKEISEFGVERHGGNAFRVFYVVAPDGLCYWFGERQAGAA